jgi:hypothetical protein
MDRFVLALIAGVAGGAGGAAAVHLLWPPAAERPAEEGGATVPREVTDRLERIESALAALRGQPGLEGKRPEAAIPAPAQPAAAAPMAADPRALAEIARVAAEAVDKRFAERDAAKAADAAKRERKRLSLAEASRELGLSASEEAELRRIYAQTQEKILKMLAEPDGDVEQVRKDLEAAQKDQRARGAVMMKYLPKALPKMGELVGVGMEQDAAVVTAVGEEKAERLKTYDVVEANPFGLGGNMGR